MMKTKCLYCYEELAGNADFHEKCSLNFFGVSEPPDLSYSLDQMVDLAKDVVERSIAVPGVQPKLSMSIVKEPENNSRLTVVGALGGLYIFKPPSEQFQSLPENEHLTMRMAEAFGIRVVPSSLIRLKSGELSYITKRIDRTVQGEKIHMLDMFQITESIDKYRGSMESIGKVLNQYSDNTLLDKILFFELVVFSFLTGNNDMHFKNISMIEAASGWILAPAYDLLNVAIVLPEDKEELALTLEGKKKKLDCRNFENFGMGMGLTIKQVEGVFQRMHKNTPMAFEWINKSFLSAELKKMYCELFETRLQRVS